MEDAPPLFDALDALEMEDEAEQEQASVTRASALSGVPIKWRGQEIKPAGIQRHGFVLRMGLLDRIKGTEPAELAQSDPMESIELLWIYLGPFEAVRDSVYVPDPAARLNRLNYMVFQNAAHAWGADLSFADLVEGLRAVFSVEARRLASDFDIIKDLTDPPSGNALGQS